MAERLDRFPAQHPRSKYPWEQWLDGSVWQLWKGDDYAISTAAMRAAAWKAATGRGKELRTRAVTQGDREGLIIEAFDSDEDD